MLNIGYKNNRSFYKLLLAIMLPIALQNLISSALNLVDNVMIGQLGEMPIAAVGLANQVFFLMTLMLFGGNSGASIFIAQFWGKKDVPQVKNALSLALQFGFILSSLFFIMGFFFPKMLLSILSNDPEVIQTGAEYLKIVSVSFVVTAIGFSYSSASRSIGRPKLPMYASALSLVINTALNYVLIFGHLGFNAYGVKGAAIATLIARFIVL